MWPCLIPLEQCWQRCNHTFFLVKDCTWEGIIISVISTFRSHTHTHKGLDGSKLIYDSFRILGAVVVIIGLYSVLWGKEGDQNHIKFQEKSDELQGCQLQQGTSKRDVPWRVDKSIGCFHFYFFTCFAW